MKNFLRICFGVVLVSGLIMGAANMPYAKHSADPGTGGGTGGKAIFK